MSGPRKPKSLDKYCDVESAARGLEQFARDLRNSQDGMLVRWDLNVRFWHPSWESKRPIGADEEATT